MGSWGEVWSFVWAELTKDRFSYLEYMAYIATFLTIRMIWIAWREDG